MNKLIEGDSFEVMTRLIGENVQFSCIWTDPPYLLSNGGSTCKSGKRTTVDKGEWDRHDNPLEFNREWVNLATQLLKPGGSLWVSGTFHNIPHVAIAVEENGLKTRNWVIWEKPAPPPNLGCRSLTHSTEILIWAVKEGARFTFNYELMKQFNDGKQLKDVWKLNPPSKSEKLHGKHPTQKPVELVKRCLMATTNRGDSVLDPFGGSGTTGVVCGDLGLDCTLIESNSEFIKLAKLRIGG